MRCRNNIFLREELLELQDEDFAQSVQLAQRKAQQTYVEVKERLSSGVGAAALLWELSIEDFLWAQTIVDSRGLRFQGSVYLAPYADMFNYRPHEEGRRSNSGDFFLLHHKLAADGAVTVTADRDAGRGEQLFEDYGDNDDRIYFQFHGFVADDNPFRCLPFRKDPYSYGLSAKQEKLLQLLRLLPPGGSKDENIKGQFDLKQCVDKSGYFGMRMEVFAISLAFSEEQVDSCVKIIKDYDALNGEAGGGGKKFNHILNSCGFSAAIQSLEGLRNGTVANSADRDPMLSRTVSLLGVLLSEKKALYATTIDEDAVLLANTQSQHMVLLLRFRMAMKTLLASLLPLYAAPRISNDDVGLAGRLRAFNDWFARTSPLASKIRAEESLLYRVGTVATEAVSAGQLYLGVPTSIVLDAAAYEDGSSEYNQLVDALFAKFKRHDDFHELLLFLLYEYYILGVKSRFWPYLSMLPSLRDLDVPAQWTDEQVEQRLHPSYLVADVRSYNRRVRKSFEFIAKVDVIASFFHEDFLTFDKYLWATVVLDSRSIWWDGRRHLVPMLDFVNCKEGPAGSAVHSTALDGSRRFALTNSSWDFAAGEELFENYGQPNHIYFQYHGFSLLDNSYDCVIFELAITAEELKRIDMGKAAKLMRHIDLPAASVDNNDVAKNFCLKYPVSESVWLFLSLKLNVYEALTNARQMGVPTRTLQSALARIVDSHIAKYDVRDGSHQPSQFFLDTELALLIDLKAKLAAHSSSAFNDDGLHDEL